MKTIAQIWTEFEAAVIPDVGKLQRKEMRRAFYAGVHSCLMLGLQVADESGDNDDLGATMMQRLHEECQAFAKEIEAGRA